MVRQVSPFLALLEAMAIILLSAPTTRHCLVSPPIWSLPLVEDFLTQARAPGAPPEIRALVRQGTGGIYRSTLLYKAPGLSLP